MEAGRADHCCLAAGGAFYRTFPNTYTFTCVVLFCFRDIDPTSLIVVDDELRPYVARRLAARPARRQRQGGWTATELAVIDLMGDKDVEPRVLSVRASFSAKPHLRSIRRSEAAIALKLGGR